MLIEDPIDAHSVAMLPYAKHLVTDLPHAESVLWVACTVAVGAASVCWDNIVGAGVFEDQMAMRVVETLMAEVIAATGLGTPHLGCATTEALMSELMCRMELAWLGHMDPAYRTV